MNVTARNLLQLPDLAATELRTLLEDAIRIKSGQIGVDWPLRGKTLGMIFRKHSTRTRVSFDVGMHQLGGHGVLLSDRDSQIGRGESVADTARVLSRYLNALVVRTFRQDEVEEWARFATIPVINGLTDLVHPCQLLADLLTVREAFGPRFEELTVAWVGDGNNVLNSWLNAASLLGFTLRMAVPEGYEPDDEILSGARRNATIHHFRQPEEAVEGAHVVTTDTWASMGQEEESEARARDFASYRVDTELMARARDDSIFLHCLPAYRGKEVTAEVLDGPNSRVLDEAENRLHAQKALLLFLMG